MSKTVLFMRKANFTCDGAKWDESKHPRKDNGQFGNGGGGSSTNANVEKVFSESKMRDKKGKLHVYTHGSSKRFSVFDLKKVKTGGCGFMFGTESGSAGYGYTYHCNLNIKKPLVLHNGEVELFTKLLPSLRHEYAKVDRLDGKIKGGYGSKSWKAWMTANKALYAKAKRLLTANGYDGIIWHTPGFRRSISQILVFDPKQIHIRKVVKDK